MSISVPKSRGQRVVSGSASTGITSRTAGEFGSEGLMRNHQIVYLDPQAKALMARVKRIRAIIEKYEIRRD
jgi:hypothetical protein